MANNSVNNWIKKSGFHGIDLFRKIFCILAGGAALVINMLIGPRVMLLYKDAGVPLSSSNTYLSYGAIIALFVLAFIPFSKDTASLVKSFITFSLLGIVLLSVSLFSIISAIYTLTSVLP